jgi:RNA polymerase sigma-70 factor (ECF subfamily)
MTATRELDASRPLGPLVLTTVRNLCLNELRRVRPGSLQAREAATGEVVRERPSSDPLEQLGAAERRDAVQTALARLSPAWREMVYLRDGLGFSYREVAAVAETSEDVVRTTLYRARARLRELLAAHAPEGGPR